MFVARFQLSFPKTQFGRISTTEANSIRSVDGLSSSKKQRQWLKGLVFAVGAHYLRDEIWPPCSPSGGAAGVAVMQAANLRDGDDRSAILPER
jgi:hypothetical protein